MRFPRAAFTAGTVALLGMVLGLCWWLFGRPGPPIVIGAILPVTGEYARFGGSVARGIGLAMEEVNLSGGVEGREIVVDVEDSGRDPARGVAAAQKLIDEAKAPAIIGAMGSRVTLAIAPVVEQSRTVLLSPASSAPEISDAGDFVFRNYPSDSLQAELLGEFAVRQACTRGALLVSDSDQDAVLAHAFQMAFRAAGGNIVYDERFTSRPRDIDERVDRLADASAECVFVVGENRDLREIVRAGRTAGVVVPFYSPVIFHEDVSVAEAAQPVRGVVFSVPVFDSDASSPTTERFSQAYREKFGDEPDIWAAHGYDALRLLIEAMRSHGFTGPEIRDGLYAIERYEGVAGQTSFDARGDVRRPGRFLTMRGGELVLLAGD